MKEDEFNQNNVGAEGENVQGEKRLAEEKFLSTEELMKMF